MVNGRTYTYVCRSLRIMSPHAVGRVPAGISRLCSSHTQTGFHRIIGGKTCTCIPSAWAGAVCTYTDYLLRYVLT